MHHYLDAISGSFRFSHIFLPNNPIGSDWTGRVTYKIMEEFWASWTTVSGRTFRIRCPQFYITDFASTPPFSWLLGFPQDGLWRIPALFHDINYMWQGVLPEGWLQELVKGEWVNVTAKFHKSDCDQFFFIMMLEFHVSNIRAGIMLSAVRTPFGLYAWHKTDPSRLQFLDAFVVA